MRISIRARSANEAPASRIDDCNLISTSGKLALANGDGLIDDRTASTAKKIIGNDPERTAYVFAYKFKLTEKEGFKRAVPSGIAVGTDSAQTSIGAAVPHHTVTIESGGRSISIGRSWRNSFAGNDNSCAPSVPN